MQHPSTLLPLPVIKKCLKASKLRPETVIDPQTTPFSDDLTDMADQVFFGIHFYWNEYYYDNINGDKIQHLCQMLNEEISKIPGYRSHEWGASDGHLFCYININK